MERWVSRTHGAGNPELSRPSNAHMRADVMNLRWASEMEAHRTPPFRNYCMMQCGDRHPIVRRTVQGFSGEDWFDGSRTARNLITGRDLRQKTPGWWMFLPVRGLRSATVAVRAAVQWNKEEKSDRWVLHQAAQWGWMESFIWSNLQKFWPGVLLQGTSLIGQRFTLNRYLSNTHVSKLIFTLSLCLVYPSRWQSD